MNASVSDLNEINEAFQNHEFKVYYQPQYNTMTNQLAGAEALVRRIKPDGSLIMPGSFIPQFEDNGIIVDLDWYMLKEVCAFLKKQKENNIPSVPVSVNFSRLHIRENNFVERLCEITDSYNIPHRMIKAEITESAFVEHAEKISEWINAIRSAGFQVAIDDFGSGLSSLSFVKDISVDILKLDKSLLSRNCEDKKERIVLESIFTFAHRLKLTTIAEGVETPEQLGFLKTCSCKEIQGFLFAKPMPEEDFSKLCIEKSAEVITDDILAVQNTSSTAQLLLDAVFIRFPLVIVSNLTRNSFYMMTKKNFTSTVCSSSGAFDESIIHAAETMHPDDRELFRRTFSIENQLAAHKRGEPFVRAVTRQIGDDGVYRMAETTNYFVKSPFVDDVIVITLCQNI